MSSVSSLTSAKRGVAPARTTAAAVAMNVFAGTTTSSPGPTPSAVRLSCRASVPFARPTAWSAPQYAAQLSLEGRDRRAADVRAVEQARQIVLLDLRPDFTRHGAQVGKRDAGHLAGYRAVKVHRRARHVSQRRSWRWSRRARPAEPACRCATSARATGPLFPQRDLGAFQGLDDGQAAAAVHAGRRVVGDAVDEVLILDRQRLGKGDERRHHRRPGGRRLRTAARRSHRAGSPICRRRGSARRRPCRRTRPSSWSPPPLSGAPCGDPAS